jgi:hypothetical protein
MQEFSMTNMIKVPEDKFALLVLHRRKEAYHVNSTLISVRKLIETGWRGGVTYKPSTITIWLEKAEGWWKSLSEERRAELLSEYHETDEAFFEHLDKLSAGKIVSLR